MLSFVTTNTKVQCFQRGKVLSPDFWITTQSFDDRVPGQDNIDVRGRCEGNILLMLFIPSRFISVNWLGS